MHRQTRRRLPLTTIQAISEMMDNGLGEPGGMANMGQMMATSIDMMSTEPDSTTVEDDGDDDNYSEDELRLAKQFIQLIGSADRARELVDRCNECLECLGLVDDDQEAADIQRISDATPEDPSMPSNNPMVAQFSPSTGMSSGIY